MTSIRQNPSVARLPDFSSPGVWLRILLGANALAALAALAANRQLAELPGELAIAAAALEPPLFASLLLLRVLRRLLLRLPYRAGLALVVSMVLLTTAATHVLGAALAGPSNGHASLLRPLFWAGLCSVVLLAYFATRARLQTPALAEARLMALTARIRPHFLFNALNAVLGVMRSDPRRAEGALEELSDLFRVLMRENRELVRLSDEIALARQYLNLERLRLGERLQVKWDIQDCPPDALMPPLMLQPLLENAVYHGIEPADQPGEINIRLVRHGDRLLIAMTNPYDPAASPHAGNQMALDNIRERLMLFYDLDARLETAAESATGIYTVRITIPCRMKEAA